MKVVAPGKLLLFGAYSVLEGTPALVVAVDRLAVADTDRLAPSPLREVRAAIGDEPAPAVDVRALYEGDAKLGLGSSAAALVATLGARAAMRGKDLADAAVRKELFLAARDAHAQAQGGGSGVDVAASTYGGALLYGMLPAHDPLVLPLDLPEELELRVFWSGTSARTSDLLARVRKLAERDPSAFKSCMDAIGFAAIKVRGACNDDDVSAFIDIGKANARALAELGRAADAPIVPATFAALSAPAEEEDAAFYPSGAGGGDVGVWLGADPPSDDFIQRARSAGMFLLDVGMDRAGVRTRKD